jgi:hypothetical protein
MTRRPSCCWTASAIATGALTLAGCGFDFEATIRCTNGVQDGSETLTDCGGDCGACYGDPCQATNDCAAATCEAGRCNPPPSKTRRTWQSFSPVEAPTIRYGAAFAPLDADGGGLVLTGGYGDGDYKTETWVLVDKKFTLREDLTSPKRAYFGMIHRGGTVGPIAFGGETGNMTVTQNAATWDDAAGAWVPASPLSLPAPRYRFATAHDDTEGRTLVLGGLVAKTPSSDLLVLADDENAEWETVDATTDRPSPRHDHAMAYDPRAGVFVVFGGRTASEAGSEIGETWIFDGAAFREIDSAGPAPRFGHVMVYHPDARRIVLFGGNHDDYQGFNDTWEFDAENERWSEIETPKRPEVKDGSFPAVAYDPARHRLVLCRGTVMYNTTYEYVVSGNACGEPAECGTGFCADGVCCETACEGGACNTTESPGICVQ